MEDRGVWVDASIPCTHTEASTYTAVSICPVCDTAYLLTKDVGRVRQELQQLREVASQETSTLIDRMLSYLD